MEFLTCPIKIARLTCALVRMSVVSQQLPHHVAVRLHEIFSANEDMYAILTIFHQHIEEDSSHLNGCEVF